MGNYVTTSPLQRLRAKRRKCHDSDDESIDCNCDGIDRQLSTPKRKKLMTTSHYIHKTLYQDGENSDVTIVALGVEWKLHRVYLRQSSYFASMFSGAWKEAHDDVIRIEIIDPNITVPALNVVFSSLYLDEILIEPSKVVSVVAAASLFQLDPLIRQAVEIMMETINVQTVVEYHSVSKHYGFSDLTKSCFTWLLVNLLGSLADHPKRLREVSQELMVDLLSSSELYVIQTEFSTYFLLKMWLFLQEKRSWEGTKDDCVSESHTFFKEYEDDCFLSSEVGRPYQPVFKVLRLEHLINHHFDVEMLEHDKIIPTEWLNNVYRQQWYRMLRVDQGADKGPKQLPDEDFRRLCFRCGRTLLNDGFHLWRWTGFNFGLDILVTCDKRIIKFRRNHRTDGENQSALSLSPIRHIMYRLTVTSVDNQRQIKYTASTDLRKVNLGKNEEIHVLTIDKTATFPIVLSANFLVISPVDSANTSLTKNGNCELLSSPISTTTTTTNR